MKKKEQYSYVFEGDPIPLARARVHGNSKRMWDPQKRIKVVLGITLRSQHNDRPLLEGPLALDITFYMPIPKTRKKENLENKPHFYKADIDNLIKWICDVGTGILYKDDCTISSINAKKIYSNKPRTEFTLRKL